MTEKSVSILQCMTIYKTPINIHIINCRSEINFERSLSVAYNIFATFIFLFRSAGIPVRYIVVRIQTTHILMIMRERK
jgi:hypothetical protein